MNTCLIYVCSKYDQSETERILERERNEKRPSKGSWGDVDVTLSQLKTFLKNLVLILSGKKELQINCSGCISSAICITRYSE